MSLIWRGFVPSGVVCSCCVCNSAQEQPVRCRSAEFTPVKQHSAAWKRQSISIAFFSGMYLLNWTRKLRDIFSYIRSSPSKFGTWTSYLKFPLTLEVFSVLVRTVGKNSLATKQYSFFCNTIRSTLGGHWVTTALWHFGECHLTKVPLKGVVSLSSRAQSSRGL